MGLATRVSHDPGEDQSPGDRAEHALRPFVAGFAVPLFAFTSAGVTVRDVGDSTAPVESFGATLTSPVALGVLVGLLVGKPIGVIGGAWLMARFTRASLNPALRWADVIAVGVLAGIGFTVSLLIAELAFEEDPQLLTDAKVGILAATVRGCGALRPVPGASQARPGPDRGRGGRRLRRRRDPRRLRAREVGHNGLRSRRPRRQGPSRDSLAPTSSKGLRMDSNSDTSVSTLVNSAITDAQSLVRQQIELAKAEVAQSAKQAAGASGLLIGAAVLAFLAFVFALVAGAYGLVAAGLPVWAGFLIVAGVLLLVGIILGLVGKSRTKHITPPQRAIGGVEKTKASLSGITASAKPGSALAPATDSAVTVPAP